MKWKFKVAENGIHSKHLYLRITLKHSIYYSGWVNVLCYNTFFHHLCYFAKTVLLKYALQRSVKKTNKLTSVIRSLVVGIESVYRAKGVVIHLSKHRRSLSSYGYFFFFFFFPSMLAATIRRSSSSDTGTTSPVKCQKHGGGRNRLEWKEFRRLHFLLDRQRPGQRGESPEAGELSLRQPFTAEAAGTGTLPGDRARVDRETLF